MATLDEAVNLRENGVKKPILVLGYVDPYEFDILVSYEITATVFDVETAQLLADAARVQKKQAHCHIKVVPVCEESDWNRMRMVLPL